MLNYSGFRWQSGPVNARGDQASRAARPRLQERAHQIGVLRRRADDQVAAREFARMPWVHVFEDGKAARKKFSGFSAPHVSRRRCILRPRLQAGVAEGGRQSDVSLIRTFIPGFAKEELR
jgi:hypothetical protein